MDRIEIILDDGNSLDLSSAIAFPLNYQIDDIRDPSTTNGNYSKTISLPGTKNNNVRLGNLFDINSDFTFFNPNIKTFGKIKVNSIVMMDGYFQLKNIRKVTNTDVKGNEIVYDIVFYENVSDLFSIIANDFVSDLDLSYLDHTIDHAEIVKTWTEDYTYGYLYHMKPANNINNIWRTNDFQPALYHRHLLERIIENAGYEVGGSFFTDGNEAYYNQEVIPFTNASFDYNSTIFEQKKFRAGTTGYTDVLQEEQTQNGTLWGRINMEMDDDSTDPNFDNNNNWNTTLFEWDIISSGIFTIDFSFDFTMVQTTSSSESFYTDANQPYTPGGSFQSYPERTNVAVYMYVNGEHMFQTNNYIDDLLYSELRSGFPISTPFSIKGTIGDSNLLQAGDVITFEIVLRNQLAFRYTNGYTATLTTENTSFIFNTPTKNVVLDGDTMEINNYLPANLKQSDVLLDLQRRYNAFFRLDPTNPRKILISTRDEFYSDGVVVDWSDKRDFSVESISLLTDLQDKKLLFTYKSDNDPANKNYTESTGGDVYGQKRIEYTNEFTGSEKKIETPFSATPLIYSDNHSQGMILPSIVEDSNIRVLYYGGVIDTLNDVEWIYDETDRSGSDFFHTEYPYVGHFDNPISPTIDINFGSNDFYYYNDLLGTTENTMYDRYWKNYVEQVSDSKMLKCKLYLTISDISFIRENMNAKIWLNDAYYNVNKIIDFNPIDNTLTEVELILQKPFQKFDPFTLDVTVTEPVTVLDIVIIKKWDWLKKKDLKIIADPLILTGTPLTQPARPGTGGVIQSGDIAGSLRTSTTVNNQILSPDSIVSGDKNAVKQDSTSIMAIGNNNLVNSESRNSGVLGGNDNTLDGVTGSWIIGANEKTVSQDNEIWLGDALHIINGAIIPSYNLVEGGLNEVRSLFPGTEDNLIEGGLDEVRVEFATSTINLISG